jgi:cell pole-organizing protein PopZ
VQEPPVEEFQQALDVQEPVASTTNAETQFETTLQRRLKSKRVKRRSNNQPLLSRTAAIAIDREFQMLAQIADGPWNSRLDAMAREIMRPMLRVWLDQHLPKLVRQLVREEIERISGASKRPGA